jgi:hypothetical protein
MEENTNLEVQDNSSVSENTENIVKEINEDTGISKKKRGRSIQRPFPQISFEEALELAINIHKFAAGHDIRRLTLFEKINRSPDSGLSRTLIYNSSRYSITKGNHSSEMLSLTDEGKLASDQDTSADKALKAKFELAIMRIIPFKTLYEKYKNSRFPSPEVIKDDFKNLNVGEEHLQDGVDIFIKNLSCIGLLRTIGGAQRLISIEQALEQIPTSATKSEITSEPVGKEEKEITNTDYDKICFFIAAIGEEGTEQRKHSDMLLSSFVEPSLSNTGLKVIRADKIAKAGMISSQVLEYILCSKLVIVDLSFHNPNVFYELAIRHMIGLPTVHIIRDQDLIPFDLANFRTIRINTSDKYELVMQVEPIRNQISNYVREIFTNPNSKGTNPIRTFFPNLNVKY